MQDLQNNQKLNTAEAANYLGLTYNSFTKKRYKWNLHPSERIPLKDGNLLYLYSKTDLDVVKKQINPLTEIDKQKGIRYHGGNNKFYIGPEYRKAVKYENIEDARKAVPKPWWKIW